MRKNIFFLKSIMSGISKTIMSIYWPSVISFYNSSPECGIDNRGPGSNLSSTKQRGLFLLGLMWVANVQGIISSTLRTPNRSLYDFSKSVISCLQLRDYVITNPFTEIGEYIM